MTIPPLPPEELRLEASHVVVGRVRQVYSALVEGRRPGWTDRAQCLDVTVEEVEAGRDLDPDGPVYVHTRTPLDRPDDWSGDAGQQRLPGRGDRARFFLERGDDGRYRFVAPNGCEPA